MARSYEPCYAPREPNPARAAILGLESMLNYLDLLACKDYRRGTMTDRAQRDGAGPRHQAWPMGKCFHNAEATFLGREGGRAGWATRGRENLRPTR